MIKSNDRVKINLSVYQLVNYKQEVIVKPEEADILRNTHHANKYSEAAKIIKDNIDSTHRNEGGFFHVQILEKS